VGEPVLGHLGQRFMKTRFQLVRSTVDIRVVAGARGIHDVLLACHDVLDVSRQSTPRAEQIYLENELVELVVLIEEMLQGSIGYDTAIPEVICADLNHRQRRRERAAGHDVLGLNLLLEIVKVDEISRKKIDGAHCKTGYLIVDYRKNDKIVERILEGPTVIIAPNAFFPCNAKPRIFR